MAETEEEAGELRREQEGAAGGLSLYLDELERLNQEEDAPAREVFARAAAGEQEARKETDRLVSSSDLPHGRRDGGRGESRGGSHPGRESGTPYGSEEMERWKARRLTRRFC